jgi:elongation factor Ts
MEITVDMIRELREMTSCGVIECKKALEEAVGDIDKAKDVLRKRGLELAAKKSDRIAKEGRIESYVHLGNKIGVLLEVNCETDFVARSDKFCQFTKDVAMHIAAFSPKYIKREDIPEDILKRQPDPEVFVKAVCLLDQPFVRDPQRTVHDCLNALIASIGENMFIGRFVRYKVSEVD